MSVLGNEGVEQQVLGGGICSHTYTYALIYKYSIEAYISV